jgi:hypothetical protein
METATCLKNREKIASTSALAYEKMPLNGKLKGGRIDDHFKNRMENGDGHDYMQINLY